MVNFTQEYIDFYKAIVDETATLGLYQNAMDYIEEQFSNYSISDSEKADMTISFMSSVTQSVITSAMQLALTGVNAKLKIDNEMSLLELEKQKSQLDIDAKTTTNETLVIQKEILQSQKEVQILEVDAKTTANETLVIQKEILQIQKDAQELENEKSQLDIDAKTIANETLVIQKEILQSQQDVQALELATKTTTNETLVIQKNLLQSQKEAQDLENQKSQLDIDAKTTTNETLIIQKDVLLSQKASQDLQTLLIEAEKNYKIKQEQMLTITNNDNKLIKALDSTSDMIGTIGAGGLVIPQQLIQNYFDMVNALLGTTLNGQINVGTKAS